MMKRIVVIALMVLLVGAATGGVVMASAPNSGDCVPDGSGWGEDDPRPGKCNGNGPAPNAGDGIPDGSGF